MRFTALLKSVGGACTAHDSQIRAQTWFTDAWLDRLPMTLPLQRVMWSAKTVMG